jgi:glycosyltransferase involved in cell wall biosynthesis
LLVASEFMRRSLLACGFAEEQVEVLPLFVPEAETSPRETEAPPRSEVLFVGRIMPEKGLEDLVRALPLIKQPCRLVVVGDGLARGTSERLAARLGISGRVTFAGWQDDVQPFYRRASLLAVPSIWPEPFGLIGLEAMAQALPVVAYRSGGIPEWLTDGVTGTLVEPGDVHGLAAAIDALIADPALARRLGVAGQRRQRESFGAGRHVARLEAILAAAGSGRGKRR